MFGCGYSAVTAEYAWNLYSTGGIGGLLTTKQGTSKSHYLYNHLGHVMAMVDASDEKVASYNYSPYGTVSGSDFSQQPFGYSTKCSDFASGLVYFGYRFYMPNLGRWLNRDPLQEQGGINLYAYVNGDPMGYVDPDGRNPLVVGAGIGGVVAGPPGAVVGAVGAATGVAICLLTDLCNFNESAEDPNDITEDLLDGLEPDPDPHDYPSDRTPEQCHEDFDRYPGDEIPVNKPGTRVKKLPDGRTINIHDSHTRPGVITLDLPKPGSNKKRIKIRYQG